MSRSINRVGFDDGFQSVLINGVHNVENTPNVHDLTVFDEPMMCTRCYGKHVGFTCPTYDID